MAAATSVGEAAGAIRIDAATLQCGEIVDGRDEHRINCKGKKGLEVCGLGEFVVVVGFRLAEEQFGGALATGSGFDEQTASDEHWPHLA